MLTLDPSDRLRAGAAVWKIDLSSHTIAQFARLGEMLFEANAFLNLTRISMPDVVPLHFLDSLAMASVLWPSPGQKLIDIGCGAGFPGLPLALAFPDLHVTLLDGTLKKLAFIDSVIAQLGIHNAATLHGRAEELGRISAHRGQYDIATARAVAKLPKLAAWMLPFVRLGGAAVSYKSIGSVDEVDESRRHVAGLGAVIETIVDVPLPSTDITRRLIVLTKTGPVAALTRSPSKKTR